VSIVDSIPPSFSLILVENDHQSRRKITGVNHLGAYIPRRKLVADFRAALDEGLSKL
jgi:hypothetical protein